MSDLTDLVDTALQRAGSPEAMPPRASGWLPVRRLHTGHRPQIRTHLLALDASDRQLRFGQPASDEQIAHYVEQLRFDRDELLGIFDRALRLKAMAHLAFAETPEGPGGRAEFGVSVLGAARGRGFGWRLFEQAMVHARNRGIRSLVIYAARENAPMLAILRRAGARIQYDGADALAELPLPPQTLASVLSQSLDEQLAQMDYQLKREGRRLDRLWSRALGVPPAGQDSD